jgi:hypothetical protein
MNPIPGLVSTSSISEGLTVMTSWDLRLVNTQSKTRRTNNDLFRGSVNFILIDFLMIKENADI